MYYYAPKRKSILHHLDLLVPLYDIVFVITHPIWQKKRWKNLLYERNLKIRMGNLRQNDFWGTFKEKSKKTTVVMYFHKSYYPRQLYTITYYSLLTISPLMMIMIDTKDSTTMNLTLSIYEIKYYNTIF